MKRSLLTTFAAAVLLSAGCAVAAEVTSSTTTTWTNEDGAMIREHTTTKHYNTITDPQIDTKVGVALPQSVTVYPLPETIKVEQPDRYSYVVINDHPVVIERSTRRVVHSW